MYTDGVELLVLTAFVTSASLPKTSFLTPLTTNLRLVVFKMVVDRWIKKYYNNRIMNGRTLRYG